MIEPLISLAFAMHTNPGAYALLLGSGVSRAANIPTGWEVVLDLIERVARARGDDTGGDAVAWFNREYGRDPDYSILLGELAAAPAERNKLLRAYFEPDEEEREQGLKLPTPAHRAIAGLVASGDVRVIVTTNFDRLLETALEDVGIRPTTIATPDATEGALPLAHTACTIVKVHGDYLDARILNTPDELARYDDRIDRLLDRIFDEYGVVVCGWSAEWDAALRDAFSRCSTHRYTTFWATRGEPSAAAADLIELRRGVVIETAGADEFFASLEEKVTSLAELNAPHPLSAKIAVATLKRYLPEERHRIRLFDLVNDEVTRLERETDAAAFPLHGDKPTRESMLRRLERYEALCEPLVSIVAIGCYWGEQEHRALWARVLDRLANRFHDEGGTETWLNLRYYPAVLALYAGGIAATAAEQYETLLSLFGDVAVRRWGETEPFIVALPLPRVVKEDFLQPENERRHTPASDRVGDVLREPLREVLPHQQQYEDAFDKFEYLLALAFADHTFRDGQVWAPVGSFGWRQRRRRDSIYDEVEREVGAQGSEWGLLRGRLFDGSSARFEEVRQAFLEQVLRPLPWL